MVSFYDRQTGVTSNLSWTWLKKGGYKKETEGLLAAGQDQALRTNVKKVKIEKQAVSCQTLITAG